jgi:hypothetical protein
MIVGHCTGVLPPPELVLKRAPARLRLAQRPLSDAVAAGRGPEAETPPPRA